MNARILVVEDDDNQRSFLEKVLKENNFLVDSCENGSDCLKQVEKTKPDLVLLDLGLPDISGETVFAEIKKIYPDLPIVILTAKGAVSDIVEGFNLGAEDYVTKPYDFEELLARVKARIKNQPTEDILKVKDLEVNTKSYEVKRNSNLIQLTPREFDLLTYLIINKNQVLSRDMILNRIWDYPDDIESRAVDVYVGYLRKKVDGGHKEKIIHTIRGYGYMLKD